MRTDGPSLTEDPVDDDLVYIYFKDASDMLLASEDPQLHPAPMCDIHCLEVYIPMRLLSKNINDKLKESLLRLPQCSSERPYSERLNRSQKTGAQKEAPKAGGLTRYMTGVAKPQISFEEEEMCSKLLDYFDSGFTVSLWHKQEMLAGLIPKRPKQMSLSWFKRHIQAVRIHHNSDPEYITKHGMYNLRVECTDLDAAIMLSEHLVGLKDDPEYRDFGRASLARVSITPEFDNQSRRTHFEINQDEFSQQQHVQSLLRALKEVKEQIIAAEDCDSSACILKFGCWSSALASLIRFVPYSEMFFPINCRQTVMKAITEFSGDGYRLQVHLGMRRQASYRSCLRLQATYPDIAPGSRVTTGIGSLRAWGYDWGNLYVVKGERSIAETNFVESQAMNVAKAQAENKTEINELLRPRDEEHLSRHLSHEELEQIKHRLDSESGFRHAPLGRYPYHQVSTESYSAAQLDAYSLFSMDSMSEAASIMDNRLGLTRPPKTAETVRFVKLISSQYCNHKHYPAGSDPSEPMPELEMPETVVSMPRLTQMRSIEAVEAYADLTHLHSRVHREAVNTSPQPMPFACASSTSRHKSPKAAATLAYNHLVSQLNSTDDLRGGGMDSSEEPLKQPTVLLCFTVGFLKADVQEILNTLTKLAPQEAPGCQIVGGSSHSATLNEDGFQAATGRLDGSSCTVGSGRLLTLFAIYDPEGRYALVASQDLDEDNVRSLLEPWRGQEPKMILSSMPIRRESAIIDAVNQVIGDHVPVLGFSGAPWRPPEENGEVLLEGLQMAGDQVFNQGFALLMMWPTVETHVNLTHPFRQVESKTGIVEQVEHKDGCSQVNELRVRESTDHLPGSAETVKPASEVFREWLSDVEPNMLTALEIEQKAETQDGETCRIKFCAVTAKNSDQKKDDLYHRNPAQMVLPLMPELAKGDRVTLACATSRHVASSMVSSLRSAIKNSHFADEANAGCLYGGILVCCAGMLQNMPAGMKGATQEMVSNLYDCPVAGCFSYGENGPVKKTVVDTPSVVTRVASPWTMGDASMERTRNVHGNLMFGCLLFGRSYRRDLCGVDSQ